MQLTLTWNLVGQFDGRCRLRRPLPSPWRLAAVLSTSTVSTNASGCYNGVTVLDPYGDSCTLPGPVGKIRGSAPDASAIIACRNHPGCLATYVNGP